MDTYVFSGMAGVFNDAWRRGGFQPVVGKTSQPAARRQPVSCPGRRPLTGRCPGNITVGHIGGRSSGERDAFLATVAPRFLATLSSVARCFLSGRFRTARYSSARHVLETAWHTSKHAFPSDGARQVLQKRCPGVSLPLHKNTGGELGTIFRRRHAASLPFAARR